GADSIYAGAGNDIIELKASDIEDGAKLADTVIDGGTGIDFLLSDSNVSLDTLLGSNNGKLSGVEALIKPLTDSDLDLTNIASLNKVGITLSHNNGKDVLTLSSDWIVEKGNAELSAGNTTTFMHKTGDNNFDISLEIDNSAFSTPGEDTAAQTAIFLLENAQG
ncbi:MAG: hypothetical protein J6I40_08780, partial [Mailhella sp.]|nr:hypothetical protein [Mailhella sp.]